LIIDERSFYAAMIAEHDGGPIGTLSRGLHLLACVGKLGGRTGLAELAERSGLNRGTAHRLASKLVELGYLERDEIGRFRLSVGVLDLGFAYLASMDVRAQALPALEALRADLDCSVGLCVLDGTDTVYIERLESTTLQPTVHAVVGGRLPVHSTAIGKAILAFLPPERVRTTLDAVTFEGYTRRTLRTRADLEADLAATKKRGYALSDQEHFEGYRAVAAPVFDSFGHAVAGIVAGAVLGRFSSVRELRDVIAPRVLQASRQISQRLGWNP
jgi:DNA-binding IclR family transcriptional regulator